MPNSTDFSCETFGKWILAGEHSVLRGTPALVFPVTCYSLKLKYKKTTSPLQLDLGGSHGDNLKLLFWGVIEQAATMLGHSREDIKGKIEIVSTIPLGAGLGASAALCVAVGRLFQHFGFVEEEHLYEFSRKLENLFHGESSGVDIAVSLRSRGIRFVRGGEMSLLNLKWQPKWYLSYSGKIGMTSDCVNKVKALSDTNFKLFQRLDQQMEDSVGLAEAALDMTEAEGMPRLKKAIDMAEDCFVKWGLTTGEPSQHMQLLKQSGAIATKPTGSGGGGYVLSLWEQEPPAELNLLPV